MILFLGALIVVEIENNPHVTGLKFTFFSYFESQSLTLALPEILGQKYSRSSLEAKKCAALLRRRVAILGSLKSLQASA